MLDWRRVVLGDVIKFRRTVIIIGFTRPVRAINKCWSLILSNVSSSSGLGLENDFYNPGLLLVLEALAMVFKIPNFCERNRFIFASKKRPEIASRTFHFPDLQISGIVAKLALRIFPARGDPCPQLAGGFGSITTDSRLPTARCSFGTPDSRRA